MNLSPKYFLFSNSPMHPTVGHARDVLVMGFRDLKTARAKGLPVAHVHVGRAGPLNRGLPAEEAVMVLRRLLAGRPRHWPISIQLWQTVRRFGNATELPPPKAWWNAPRWARVHEVAPHHLASRALTQPAPDANSDDFAYPSAYA